MFCKFFFTLSEIDIASISRDLPVTSNMFNKIFKVDKQQVEMEMEHQQNEHESKKVYTISTNNEKRNEEAYSIGFQSKDPIIAIPSPEKVSKILEHESGEHGHVVKHPTNYMETLMHLFKGNVGSGVFAMGDAFKNSGIAVGPILVPVLGLICVHSQHLLLNASHYLQRNLNLEKNPGFSTTVELCFATGPARLQKLAPAMRIIVNLFLCLTQFGFCCVYFVFISTNVKQIMDYYGFVYSIHLHMAVILVPILGSCLVRNLKYLAPLSTIANVLMLTGIVITLYYAGQKPFSEVELFSSPRQLPLFFGTALFAFEGIGLVLPLQNEMKNSKNFDKPLGVLNVGMTFVTFLYLIVGILSYLKYGDGITGSVTLNLPEDEILAQTVKVMISLGILFTFALQFYIPIDIMFPSVRKYFGPLSRPILVELIFRTAFVLVTFTLAEIIPFLDLFITLVGAFSSTAIALIFPPILELVNASASSEMTAWIVIKNAFILIVGCLGCVTGSFESIKLIVKAFADGRS
ncbi:hypothetical protein RN001_015538 [Aquatica leii]|uniref:Amino acid transporter transmembrane domain-containing protein n=1 Tax=Aquatica leii TaxID=1421715 RepID=A0AAN7SDH1_9COLE|nr:hypothetical protein RN001_015538 [Aquatica leii]